jgi:uncharacterized protein YkwD
MTVAATLVAVALLALGALASGAGASLERPRNPQLNPVEQHLLDAINATRRARHLRPLVLDMHLERAARFHVHTMLGTGALIHGDFAQRMARFRVSAGIAGENLAWGAGPAGGPATMVEEWLRSPAHRMNLLLPRFARVGVGGEVGTFAGRGDATVVTVDFAGR